MSSAQRARQPWTHILSPPAPITALSWRPARAGWIEVCMTYHRKHDGTFDMDCVCGALHWQTPYVVSATDLIAATNERYKVSAVDLTHEAPSHHFSVLFDVAVREMSR